jgi:hypothetical protein
MIRRPPGGFRGNASAEVDADDDDLKHNQKPDESTNRLMCITQLICDRRSRTIRAAK